MEGIVTFNQVTFKPGEDYLLKDMSFTIYPEEMIRIEGASGSGKSTLLRLIAALIPSSSGDITYLNQPLTKVSYQEYRQNISYVAQNPHLFGETIRDNFELVFKAREQDFDEELVLNYMKDFGLAHIGLDKSIHKISGGEKQRVGLIRHLIFPPKVLLLDEITSSLDEDNRALVWKILMDYKAEHKITVIWVSHIEDGSISPNRIVHISQQQISIEECSRND
ncbi:ABC transporter ATP-binding protein [Aerococcus urinaeequi]|uniref:ABC transporter n=1 Tax=Aerococcus viridans TaxID=1377 RepID=A0A2N6UFZ6_9LACT|nr:MULTISPECIES: ATP-binding cassette domain-containing protein [Aerococcus]OFU51692.1 ABC transporter [Aerococcus sp. HMSC10H05]PMC80518.1 ABC transporter [Aerococcus viridans]